MCSIDLDLSPEKLKEVSAGESILLSGTIYSARDAAHKRVQDMLERGEALPISFKDKIIYYMGPAPARPNKPIGSCGPTSSYRMDDFLEMTLKLGAIGSMGKGSRASNVTELAKRYQAPYLLAVGGAGALLARCVISAKVVMFEELGAEALMELKIKDFPATVGIDAMGKVGFK